MSKHTPGPWYVGCEDENTGEIEVVSEDRPYICLVFPGAIDEVTPANARLIAAAPDLLKALKGLSSLYNTDEGCRSVTEYVAALAAIEKAGG